MNESSLSGTRLAAETQHRIADTQDGPEDVEGQLSAHRELMVTVLAALVESGALSATSLEQEMLVRDGQEDPGAVPASAYAIEGARAQEMRAIVERVLNRIRLHGRASGGESHLAGEVGDETPAT